ncbi:hypothetical protein ACFL4A_03195 [bacterium]
MFDMFLNLARLRSMGRLWTVLLKWHPWPDSQKLSTLKVQENIMMLSLMNKELADLVKSVYRKADTQKQMSIKQRYNLGLKFLVLDNALEEYILSEDDKRREKDADINSLIHKIKLNDLKEHVTNLRVCRNRKRLAHTIHKQDEKNQ